MKLGLQTLFFHLLFLHCLHCSGSRGPKSVLSFIPFHHPTSSPLGKPLATFKVGFPGGSVVKNLPTNAGDSGDMGLIPESRRSPAEGNGNPLQYSCLENSMNKGVVCYRVGLNLTTEHHHYHLQRTPLHTPLTTSTQPSGLESLIRSSLVTS